jgi:hypothetical protein
VQNLVYQKVFELFCQFLEHLQLFDSLPGNLARLPAIVCHAPSLVCSVLVLVLVLVLALVLVLVLICFLRLLPSQSSPHMSRKRAPHLVPFLLQPAMRKLLFWVVLPPLLEVPPLCMCVCMCMSLFSRLPRFSE